AAGAVDVTVTNPKSTSATWEADRFSYVPRPTVMTQPASDVTQESATLNATVNPDGGTVDNGLAVSDCHFEYGTTASYGSTVPCRWLPESRESRPVAVSAGAGLSAKTTYHFRI